jgi:hypothetical protein
MPLHDPFPTLEIGPFYCAYEDDHWDEPEIIVDPLSGFVVAIMPPRDRSHRPRVPHREPRPRSQERSLWRGTLSRWLRHLTCAPPPQTASPDDPEPSMTSAGRT